VEGRVDGRSLVPLLHGEPGSPPHAPVLSDLGWQRELVAETSATASVVVDAAAPAAGSEALLAERARRLASAFAPRKVDPTPSARELRGLGY